jgi:hypothetical protein
MMFAFVLIALFIGTALASAAVLADSGLRGAAALRRLRGELRALDLAGAPQQPSRRVMVIRAAGPRRAPLAALPALRAAA